jgi:hypothetical protein
MTARCDAMNAFHSMQWRSARGNTPRAMHVSVRCGDPYLTIAQSVPALHRREIALP